MTRRLNCGSATSAVNATCSRGASTPCRGRRPSRKSAAAIVPTASSSRRSIATSESSSGCSRKCRRATAARRRRAPISPPTPARSTPCWRTPRGGSRATAEPARQAGIKGRGASRALFFCPRFWHRGFMASLTVRTERWPIAGSFTIARGAKTEAAVVVVEIADGAIMGRGECVPYARYGETIEGVTAALEAMRNALGGGLDRQALQAAMPAGAARNALDCAFWDLEAKANAQAVHLLAGLPAPGPVVTAYTISLGTPEAMAAAAVK